MGKKAAEILRVLDLCAKEFTFPMMDNGYVYPAATRLSLYRSVEDWAIVIEVFGFSPRAGTPDTCVSTFASRLHDRRSAGTYVDEDAYRNYIASYPHNEMRFVHPVEPGSWSDDEESVSKATKEVKLRGKGYALPAPPDYAKLGITLEEPPRVLIFELCRYLASKAREVVLADPKERRMSVLPGMDQILQLEEWNHPDVVNESERPSGSETFQQLALILETGDIKHYSPTKPPNTHWSNWPEGGTL